MPNSTDGSRRKPEEKDDSTSRAPTESSDKELSEEDRKAAKALEAIEDVRRKLEPRG